MQIVHSKLKFQHVYIKSVFWYHFSVNDSLALLSVSVVPPVCKVANTNAFVVFSSREPSGSHGEFIIYPYSGVRRRPSSSVRPQCSNIFSSETAWPIKAKFHVESPWEGGTKVYINVHGHMTKKAATPIYGKNL